MEYKNRIGNWFRGSLSGSYSIATGKELHARTRIMIRLQQGEPENIKENYLIWDRPVQVSLNLNFTVPKEQPLFGVGRGILDDWNLFVRIFYRIGTSATRPRS